jgi:hypothetical protein
MMKMVTVIFMALGLVAVSVFSNVSSDEGPTVIIVGPEQNKKETIHDQEPENTDPYENEENIDGQESPEAIGNESENPDQQYLEENGQNTQEFENTEQE